MEDFKSLGLSEEILKAIDALGYQKPTSIQQTAIPQILSSTQDLIASAQTGTGKTAAFGLPCIEKTDLNSKEVQTLILCPTRELCLQISKDMEGFSKFLPKLKITAVFGGMDIQKQIRSLGDGSQIVVATPGRAMDLIKRKKLNLNAVKQVVLDEADEMLSMGFKDDLDFIIHSTPKERQTLLFSATISKEVQRLCKEYMSDIFELMSKKTNTGSDQVEHQYYMVQARDRYEALKRIADVNPNIYGIVFCRTRRETQEVAAKLMADGYNADALHGDLSQAQRNDVMTKFRDKILQILVATDVAARGLDVNDLTHVINYNLPDEPESYIHRSGRTGRAGRKGISIAIIHGRETGKLKIIEKRTQVKFIHTPVPTGDEICATQLLSLIDKVEKVKIDHALIDEFLPKIYEKLEHLSREELIKHFVSTEFNRFLGYYKTARDLNKTESRAERGSRLPSEGYQRMFINLGSKHRVNPAKLMGKINEALDNPNTPFGKIEILKGFSFFEIEESFAEKVLEKMNGSVDGTFDITVEIASKPNSDRGERPPREKRRSSGGSGGGGGYSGKKFDRKSGGGGSSGGGSRRKFGSGGSGSGGSGERRRNKYKGKS